LYALLNLCCRNESRDERRIKPGNLDASGKAECSGIIKRGGNCNKPLRNTRLRAVDLGSYFERSAGCG
jgi:hypothetical protein